jgi:hypothetical protein
MEREKWRERNIGRREGDREKCRERERNVR